MQITSNTTGMLAGLTVATDKEGRDHCVVVVKGTFTVGAGGKSELAEDQEPFVYADQHYGDPATTSIRYECDFARHKPKADIIVNGKAVSPTGKPVTHLTVTLEAAGLKKEIRVLGDRRWEGGMLGFRPTDPEPFVEMPLLYERAFGGSDHTHEKPKHHGTELRNPVGVGFHKNSDRKAIEGSPLPNLEDPRHPIGKWSDAPPPVGFGAIGRGWQPRLKHAGTYDEAWLKDRFPFLPLDFDDRHFQCAPEDQQVPPLSGGETVSCLNTSPAGLFSFRVPEARPPVLFRFTDRDRSGSPILDTLLIEPDRSRCLLTWRASVPLGRKMNALREVLVGRPSPPRPPRTFKRTFGSLAALASWRRAEFPPAPRSPAGGG